MAAATTHVSAGGNVSRPKTSLGDGFKWRAGGVAEAVINPSEGQVWATAAISSARHERDEVGGDRLQAYCQHVSYSRRTPASDWGLGHRGEQMAAFVGEKQSAQKVARRVIQGQV